ncbi:MAG: hypothetical protein ACKOOC_04760 [Cyanobium sp.]
MSLNCLPGKRHETPVLSPDGSSTLTSRTLLSVVLLAAAAFPINPGHLAQLQALNRELGKLCASDPPKQALTVCRLHAKLVRAF